MCWSSIFLSWELSGCVTFGQSCSYYYEQVEEQIQVDNPFSRPYNFRTVPNSVRLYVVQGFNFQLIVVSCLHQLANTSITFSRANFLLPHSCRNESEPNPRVESIGKKLEELDLDDLQRERLEAFLKKKREVGELICRRFWEVSWVGCRKWWGCYKSFAQTIRINYGPKGIVVLRLLWFVVV